MQRLPDSWIERIFERLKTIYPDSWENRPEKLDLLKITWSSALAGLSADEIKSALSMCAKNPKSPIPSPIEFYHYAKGVAYPYRLQVPERTEANKAVASVNLDKMKSKLRGDPSPRIRETLYA